MVPSGGDPVGPGGPACLRYLFRSGCFAGSEELGVGGPFSVRVGSGSFSCTTEFNIEIFILLFHFYHSEELNRTYNRSYTASEYLTNLTCLAFSFLVAFFWGISINLPQL